MVYWVVHTLEALPVRGPDTEEFYKEIDEAFPSLEEAGIDINELMALRKKIRMKMVDELNGQQVRIPGYLLPLEVSSKKVSDFLLVPSIGACIHVPPPPPNQIIYVKVDQNKAYKSKGLYEPGVGDGDHRDKIDGERSILGRWFYWSEHRVFNASDPYRALQGEPG